MQEQVLALMEMTGVDAAAAESLLQMHDGDLAAAVNMAFLMQGDTQSPTKVTERDDGGGKARGGSAEEEGDADSARLSKQPQVTSDDLAPATEEMMDDSKYFKSERLVASIPMSNKMAVTGPAPFEDEASNGALEALFAPPTSLLFIGTFEQARQHAEQQEKWLVVNILNTHDFDSLKMNRDTWPARNLADLIQNYFVLWQQTLLTPAGQAYVSAHPTEKFPQTDIIDPCTGARVYHMKGFLDDLTMSEKLATFMQDHEWGKAKPLVMKRKDPTIKPQIPELKGDESLDDDEETQRAIALSLAENDNGGVSPFSPEVACDLPEEPAADEGNVTAIAVRMANGSRISRRFQASDTVGALYAFISSVGVAVRDHMLVTTFPRQELLDKNKTLAECGLVPQGLVCIEATQQTNADNSKRRVIQRI